MEEQVEGTMIARLLPPTYIQLALWDLGFNAWAKGAPPFWQLCQDFLREKWDTHYWIELYEGNEGDPEDIPEGYGFMIISPHGDEFEDNYANGNYYDALETATVAAINGILQSEKKPLIVRP